MAFCNKCLIYNERFSELIAANQDSTPENEKPKEHFCMMFTDGIPDEIWHGTKECKHMIPESENE